MLHSPDALVSQVPAPGDEVAPAMIDTLSYSPEGMVYPEQYALDGLRLVVVNLEIAPSWGSKNKPKPPSTPANPRPGGAVPPGHKPKELPKPEDLPKGPDDPEAT